VHGFYLSLANNIKLAHNCCDPELEGETPHLSNGDLNLNTGFDGDGGDLLNDLRGGVEIDETLVDAHLEAVPGLGTVTARRLTGGDTENLGGETDGSLNLELLILGALDKVRTDLLQVLDVTRSQGDADTVDPEFRH
jgi:hypothetical protein